MEASHAGVAGGDATAYGAGSGDDGLEVGQQLDPAAFAEELESLQGDHEALRALLHAPPQPAGLEGMQDDGDFDLSFLEGGDDFEFGEEEGFDPEAAEQALTQLIGQTVQQQVQAATQPISEQQHEMRREQQMEHLVGEFPEMGDPEVAGPVIGAAGQLAEAAGHPELAGEPWFWRLTYMAGRAAEVANSEGAESAEAAHLEGGGGAGSGGGRQPDAGDQIVIGGGQRGRGALPF